MPASDRLGDPVRILRTRSGTGVVAFAGLALVLWFGLAGLALANEPVDGMHPGSAPQPAAADTSRAPDTSDPGAREPEADPEAEAVVRAISAQLAVLERTEAMVDQSLGVRRDVLRQHVRAAYKRARARPLPVWASAAERKQRLVESALVRRLLRRYAEELDEIQRERELLRDAHASLESERARAALRAWRAPALVPPVDDGRTIEAFGVYRHPGTGTRLVRRGVTISCGHGAAVRAPMAGRVRYVGEVRGLGQAVLVQHESGYWSLLGHLESEVTTGHELASGQVIGRAAGARVYLELRAPAGPGGLPVDPEPLMGRE